MAGQIKIGVPDSVIEIDPAQTETVWKALSRRETDILTFNALQFFLEREFARAYRFRSVLSLALFCVSVDGQKDPSLSHEACAVLTRAISQIKRDVDMFGHFGDRSFGLLLPMVETQQACNLVVRIDSELAKMQEAAGTLKPVLHFGLASVPQDATDLHGLVKAAQLAMIEAANRKVLKIEATELKTQ